MCAAQPHTSWVAGLSPWPADGFGLDRMLALLAELGDPQKAYPAVHVVGTNGKSTATRTIEEILLAEGLSVGATISPHVRSWSERIRVDGEEVDFEGALARVRPAAERLGATQFETHHRGGPGGVCGGRRRRRRRRGGAWRAARRHERARHARRAAHERVARAHRGAGRDAGADRAREAGSSACGDHSCHVGQHVRTRSCPGARSSSAAPARLPKPSSAGPAAADVAVHLPGRLERRGERRAPRRGPQPRGSRVAGAAASACGLLDRLLDPPRQGRAGDARGARDRRLALRRDPVVERAVAPG